MENNLNSVDAPEITDEQLDQMIEQNQQQMEYERMVRLGHHNERGL